MVRGAIQSLVWPVITPLERLTFWKAVGLVLAGLAAGSALRLAFDQWLHGHTLFVAFLPAILVVTLRGGLITGAATLFFSKSLALTGATETAGLTPRVLLWIIVGGVVVLTAFAVRELIRAQCARTRALLEREAHTMKVMAAFEAAARHAARDDADDGESQRLASTLRLLRTAIENPQQIDAVARLVAPAPVAADA